MNAPTATEPFLTALDPDGYPCDVVPTPYASTGTGHVVRTENPDRGTGPCLLDAYTITGGHPDAVAAVTSWAREREHVAPTARGHVAQTLAARARALTERLAALVPHRRPTGPERAALPDDGALLARLRAASLPPVHVDRRAA